MAIFSKYLIASSVLSAIALAAPLIQRDVVTDIVTETVWTTLDVTTTIYDNAMPATTTPAVMTPPAAQMTSTSAPTTLVPMTTPAAPPPSPTPAAEFFGTSTAPVVGATAVTSTAVAPSTSTWTSTSAAVAPSPAASGSITASSSGTCEGEGNACVGDVTHWDGGLGACGTNVDTNSDLAIALPYQFMGTASNSNPYCGRSVTLYNPTSGTTVQATVHDKCMGCLDRAIDCTDILFNQITDNMGNGRMSGIEWWLN
jgi:hypothetical protein